MGLTLEPGQKIFVDTAPLIYLIEGTGPRADKVAELLEQSIQRNVAWVTSFVTYIELLVLPTRKGLPHLAGKYRDFLTNSDQITIHPMDLLVADAAVVLRARYNLKMPDALQLAVAGVCGADIVLTNDRAWQGKADCQIVCVDEL